MASSSSSIKFCICGHVVESHDMKKGCIEIVEGSRCEDHWVCGCRCVQCIHLNASRNRNMQKQGQEKRKQTTATTAKAEENEIVVSKQKKI